jgi:hypothetical protein
MEIYHELHVIVTRHEVSDCSTFWLRESRFARIEFEAWIRCTLVHLGSKSPINTVVSIQVNSCFLSAAAFTLAHVGIAILPLVDDVCSPIACA